MLTSLKKSDIIKTILSLVFIINYLKGMSLMQNDLKQETVKELFDYKDGALFWKVTGSGIIRGLAGCPHWTGYKIVGIKRKVYQLHRVIFLWHHGYMPECEIDHINRDRGDNRIENLREVSVSCNQRNRGNPKNNNSGVKGVWWDTANRVWRSGIRVNGKQYALGSFKFKYDAVLTRLATEQCLGWEGCDSSSPAYKYAKKYKLI